MHRRRPSGNAGKKYMNNSAFTTHIWMQTIYKEDRATVRTCLLSKYDSNWKYSFQVMRMNRQTDPITVPSLFEAEDIKVSLDMYIKGVAIYGHNH